MSIAKNVQRFLCKLIIHEVLIQNGREHFQWNKPLVYPRNFRRKGGISIPHLLCRTMNIDERKMQSHPSKRLSYCAQLNQHHIFLLVR